MSSQDHYSHLNQIAIHMPSFKTIYKAGLCVKIQSNTTSYYVPYFKTSTLIHTHTFQFISFTFKTIYEMVHCTKPAKQSNKLPFATFQDHESQVNQKIGMCLTSFKTIY